MEKHRSLAERAFALMNAHDLDRLVELIADDCEVSFPGTPTMRGPRQFAVFVKAWIDAFPDIAHEIVSYVEDGDRASWEVRVTGTHTGAMQTPSGVVPATGRRITIEAVDVARFRDGKAVSWHIYNDQLAFLQQLGLAPAA
jgi:steroid delta-isomerase-like uncharacterized protein